jgi:hypothetical protein
MKINLYRLIAVPAGIVVLIASCDSSRWRTENQNYDSLFMGISLGMEKKAFYDHCWELNKQKVFTQGPKNQEVQYMLRTELASPVVMQFYPSFYKDKIFEMPVLFSYEAWAPWNKEFSSDTLFVNMFGVFKKWYGDDFEETVHPTQGKVFYKFDGTRRINLFIRDDQYVQAVFTDLLMARELKESMEKESSFEN